MKSKKDRRIEESINSMYGIYAPIDTNIGIGGVHYIKAGIISNFMDYLKSNPSQMVRSLYKVDANITKIQISNILLQKNMLDFDIFFIFVINDVMYNGMIKNYYNRYNMNIVTDYFDKNPEHLRNGDFVIKLKNIIIKLIDNKFILKFGNYKINYKFNKSISCKDINGNFLTLKDLDIINVYNLDMKNNKLYIKINNINYIIEGFNYYLFIINSKKIKKYE